MGLTCSASKSGYFDKQEQAHYKKLLTEEVKKSALRPRRQPPLCTDDPSSGRMLGKGNSTVLQAYDSNNDQLIAVKLIKVSGMPADAFDEIEREARLLATLSHEKIVTYYGSKREDGYLKIYMEYVDGGSLLTLLRSTQPFAEPIAARFTRQILEGLEYLHSHNIIHRDIKCANVLVDRHGAIKLADFGCAKEALSVLQSYYGTSGWVAPEVRKKRGYNFFADIWSLGCTVYEMLVGYSPFAKPGTTEVG